VSTNAQDPALHPELAAAFSLHGRVAVVTGAARGIGAEAALTFAKAGADVVVADIEPSGVGATCTRVLELGVSAMGATVDVSHRNSINSLARQAMDEYGRIDIWANVAGIVKVGRVVEVSEEDIRSIIEVNLLGTFWGCAAAARAMSAAGRGSIINISSTAGDIGVPNQSGYAMTKAAVHSITRTLAHEVGPAGVRVNCIAPGFTNTVMGTRTARDADGSVNPEKWAELFEERANRSPLGITGIPSDIAFCMLYLASDAARFVTGQVLRPNGGILML
jgi:3-oxoacyl-[acyl-carrier protein] reductase